MPYFSFSVNDTKNNYFKKNLTNIPEIKKNVVYYSKNTFLWKFLNKKQNTRFINFIKLEYRNKIDTLGKKILFFLPPSIGLGDSIEYALAVKAIIESNKFDKIGIAFVGKYDLIFKKYFDICDAYQNIISEDEIKNYDTYFHFTFQIKDFKYQKYDRKDIEHLITSFFSIKKSRTIKKINNRIKKSISIFPISKSPIRSMTISLLNKIISSFDCDYEVEIIMDDKSEISKTIEQQINKRSAKLLFPKDLPGLLSVIEKVNFGIFMDSGPLHVAKILNKKGVLITSSIGGNVLLNNFPNIHSINNKYKSKYCTSPCGLTNIFNYNNRSGCFDSLGIKKSDILNHKNLNNLQRGNLKKKYVNFITTPVNCLQNIDNIRIINNIKQYLLLS